jgi:NAD(P)-dependent dehydrogenase (short-subunit alcohol dehydrogenase family)
LTSITMKIACFLLAATLAAIPQCSAFSTNSVLPTRRHVSASSSLQLKADEQYDGDDRHSPKCELSRRTALSTTFAIIATTASPFLHPIVSNAQDSKGKVVVYGGSGYVGAHACSLLTQQGYAVTSISRSSPETQLARSKSILGTSLSNVDYISLDAGKASLDDLSASMKDATAVISCVGLSPGSQNQKDGNGLVNSRITQAAKAAGVPKIVYIGVSSTLANGPAKFLLGDYFSGKATAEKSVTSEFGGKNSLIIKPAIIAGGPPGEIRPPGPPGVKAVDVTAVARAAVSGAVGDLIGVIDGNEAIEAL